MIPFVANMLVRIDCPDDVTLLLAAINSVAPVVDEIVVLDMTEPFTEGENWYHSLAPDVQEKVTTLMERSDYCTTAGFAAARNILLMNSPKDCYILWIDSDEVMFTDQLQALRDTVLASGQYDDVETHFVHFCIGTNLYEKVERRVNIFRVEKGSSWTCAVHERITHPTFPRRVFHSDYTYHHYGYVRPQEIIFNRWRQYAILEGQQNPSVDTEYPDKQVLEHRRAGLLPYFGEYPVALPTEWTQEHLALMP